MADLPSSTADVMLDAGFVPGMTYYLALCTADPGTTGANEVSNTGGSSYGRQPIVFGTASASSKASTDAQNFTNMPAVAISNLAIWTGVTAGTYMGGGTASVNGGSAVPSGSTVAFAIAAVAAGLS